MAGKMLSPLKFSVLCFRKFFKRVELLKIGDQISVEGRTLKYKCRNQISGKMENHCGVKANSIFRDELLVENNFKEFSRNIKNMTYQGMQSK